jgi:hypothetical protein
MKLIISVNFEETEGFPQPNHKIKQTLGRENNTCAGMETHFLCAAVSQLAE